jgi:hypothetical protein
MVAGMIAPDIQAALLIMEAACREARNAANQHALVAAMCRLGAGLEVLKEAADRVAKLEAQPIPAHWRPQWLDTGNIPPNVVPIRKLRPTHQHGGAA